MSNLPARNRVIYQSEALFISPDTTGHHIYYMPPHTGYHPTGNTEVDILKGCIVSGIAYVGDSYDEDEGVTVKYFNACCGTEVLYHTGVGFTGFTGVAKDYKFRTYDCTGRTADGEALATGLKHPVLEEVFGGTGYYFTGEQFTGYKPVSLSGTKGLNLMSHEGDFNQSGSWGTTVEQLKRVQNANYSFTINRQDVNQFGHLARIDSVVLEAPTVSMDFSYFLTDGDNERLMGMVTDGSFQSLSGIMTRSQNTFGNNFFILTVPEGRDALKGDAMVAEDNKTVISLGNGYVTDYSIEGSVGAFPTASVTVEGMNIKSDIGTDYKTIPAIDPTDGTLICNRCFSLPPTESGDGTSVLKPGDITIDLQDAALISRHLSGDSVGYNAPEDVGSAHVQSFTLSTPMGRSALQRLGSTYAYAKEIDFPITCTLSVNALVADLKSGNLVDLICGGTYDLKVKMQNPACVVCDPSDAADAIVIDFKKATLDSESFSSAIGDNKTVDLTFTTQIGGPEESAVGVFFSGYENQTGADLLNKSFPTVYNTGDGMKYYKYGHLGTTGNQQDGEGWSKELTNHSSTSCTGTLV
jgi:hypothetical protein